jgi:hypothetical protein
MPVSNLNAYIHSLNRDSIVESLGNSAFEGAARLEGLDLSGLTLKTLGTRVFASCPSLEEVILPESLPGKTIPAFSFSGCTALVSVNIPQDIESIEQQAFYGCSEFNPDLGSLAALKTIGNAGFQGSGLRTLRLPAGITSLGQGAFQGCIYLSLAEIPEALVSLIEKNTFALCRELQFKIGSAEPSPYFIVNGTLVSYPSAKDAVVLPQGIKEIVQACFAGESGITSITLPASLETIGHSVFSSCTNLKEVVSPAPNPPALGGSAFNYHHADLKVYVPDARVADYKAADGWKDVASLIFGLSSKP